MEQALSKLYLLQTSILTDEIFPSSQTAQKITALKKRLLRELSKEQENLTEVDEKILANKLQEAILQYFNQFERRGNQTENLELLASMTRRYKNIQDLLGQITYLNLNAIHQKNEIAQETASNVILYMTILGAISTLLAIGLLIKFPDYLVNPVRKLIDRMKKMLIEIMTSVWNLRPEMSMRRWPLCLTGWRKSFRNMNTAISLN